MSDFKITPEMAEAARAETERMTRELDITNADHIVLWLETNLADGCGATLGYLACRIIEAHERANATLRAENELLREQGGFLLDRLDEFLPELTEGPAAREFYGHVAPAASRLRNALAQVAK